MIMIVGPMKWSRRSPPQERRSSARRRGKVVGQCGSACAVGERRKATSRGRCAQSLRCWPISLSPSRYEDVSAARVLNWRAGRVAAQAIPVLAQILNDAAHRVLARDVEQPARQVYRKVLTCVIQAGALLCQDQLSVPAGKACRNTQSSRIQMWRRPRAKRNMSSPPWRASLSRPLIAGSQVPSPAPRIRDNPAGDRGSDRT